MVTADLERVVWGVLGEVRDPEIPPCSITDLGMVERVEVSTDVVSVDLLPTFAGCPALDVIKVDVERAVGATVPGHRVEVRFVYQPPWTSDRITAEGHRALASFGITPPGPAGEPGGQVLIPVAALLPAEGARCPFCGSANTVMESAFGATLCRTTHFCRACRNPFEAFKPKVQP